jgi:hypothetical protein
MLDERGPVRFLAVGALTVTGSEVPVDGLGQREPLLIAEAHLAQSVSDDDHRSSSCSTALLLHS